MIGIADTGPLYAAADTNDRNHRRSLAVFQRADLHLVVPSMVLAEATYFIGTRIGPEAESKFLHASEQLDIEGPSSGDLARMSELVKQYADFPLGGTDASIVALAERLDTAVLITLDNRHFSAVKPKHCTSFELLPN